MPSDKTTKPWGPEAKKMMDRLLCGPVLPDGSRPKGYRLINFNAWWGPEGTKATPEEKAAAINRVMAQYDAGKCENIPPGMIDGDVPKTDVRDLVARLKGETDAE